MSLDALRVFSYMNRQYLIHDNDFEWVWFSTPATIGIQWTREPGTQSKAIFDPGYFKSHLCVVVLTDTYKCLLIFDEVVVDKIMIE